MYVYVYVKKLKKGGERKDCYYSIGSEMEGIRRGVAVWGIGRCTWNFIGVFYAGTGTLFISYNKVTTSVGDRLDQGSVLRM